MFMFVFLFQLEYQQEELDLEPFQYTDNKNIINLLLEVSIFPFEIFAFVVRCTTYFCSADTSQQ